jgi:uncharacterized SAM-binding protein YcdF (DUF218 family)
MKRGKCRLFWFYLLISGLVLTLNSCSFSSKTCKKLLEEASHKSYDVIVVPGVPLENGKVSKTMKERILWSKYLFEKGIAKNIIFSGSAVYSPYYEAKIMALYAKAIGIPAKHIYMETKAEHSTENIYYSYLLAKKLNFNHIALASDPFQTKLLRRYTRKKVSPNIDMLPIVFDSLNQMKLPVTEPEINIQKAFVPDFKSLPERESFWRRLRGTWGLNVDVKAYE